MLMCCNECKEVFDELQGEVILVKTEVKREVYEPSFCCTDCLATMDESEYKLTIYTVEE
ncbi:MAG: hypothetical protein ACRC68_13290 [Clostridium sp.]